MRILAIEFSSERRSAALLDAAAVRGHAAESGGRTAQPFALIDRALQQAGMSRDEIDCLVVGLGPGSYAGIRSAIALAQGWQLARGIRLLGVSSVEAMAHQAQAAGVRGLIHLLVDAQRLEFYAASYQLHAESIQLQTPLRLISMTEADALVAKDGAAGDAALAKRWPQLRLLVPDAAAVGQIALPRTDFMPGEKLQPIYLRETNFVKAPPPRILA